MSVVATIGASLLGRIVAQAQAQAQALQPDAVLIAGDLVSDKTLATRHYSLAGAIAPLRSLKSRFGTFAVLGNHDHRRDAAAARVALQKNGVQLLDNAPLRRPAGHVGHNPQSAGRLGGRRR